MAEAFIYDAVRTPRGRGKTDGSLHEVKPVSLVVGLLDAVQRRNPDLDASAIEDIVLGVGMPVGQQGSDLAKTAALAAKLPHVVPGVQLNRFCGSGLEAVSQAAARVRSGWEDLIIAGGVESMSRVSMADDAGPYATDPQTQFAFGFIPQGVGADLLATLEGFSRDDVDAFAAESQARAAKARANGWFDRSLEPVRDASGLTILDHDEFIREGTTVETLSKLKPSFAMAGDQGGFNAVALEKYSWVPRIEHVHHAGNSSGIVDGAALVVIGNEAVGERYGLRPRARILASAVVGDEPTIMLTGPGPACRKALAKAGLGVEDVDLLEINEAFAAVALRTMRDLDDFPHDRTNVNGGSIAMGHPIGATGAMLVGTVVDELERRDKRIGLVTLCVAGGMGVATVIERL
ncbi:acetyl-CoA C-acetyltransferase [Nocardioides marmoriginsengisoli]|uniref:Acetyl-CoA C-acetyltransferase n=1 Tax=Nocardioides marmoriginsengisoli TaxID=661483 RepID=A0A3N0CH24_9ACTN|nr:acetyl-CoA C-acetyltransferase [Nocardioides marmoriginsengisoli]RNL62757.1 acetyl-CoA C-acetyltransferase [Nocardioides marmoriginsengisoli]